MRLGFVVAWLGWQFDVHGDGVRLHAPVARNADGSEIRGLVRSDFNPDVAMDEMPLGHWIAGRIGGGDRFVRLRSGAFEEARIYEFVYVAKDPVVQGLGLAGVRDFTSYLKHDDGAVVHVERAYSVGISQSGRFLRHFLYEGFNEDERSRKALDGVIAHVAGAGRGSFNHRFAQPSRDAQPMSAIFYPTDLFPFSDARTTDPAAQAHGRAARRDAGALPAEALPHEHVVRVLVARRVARPHHTRREVVRPRADRRRPHLPPRRAAALHRPLPPRRDDRGARPQFPTNPNPVRWFWRALLAALDGWVRDGAPPPPSAFPRVTNGALVAPGTLRFPAVPGAKPPAPYEPFVLDFGPRFEPAAWTRS